MSLVRESISDLDSAAPGASASLVSRAPVTEHDPYPSKGRRFRRKGVVSGTRGKVDAGGTSTYLSKKAVAFDMAIHRYHAGERDVYGKRPKSITKKVLLAGAGIGAATLAGKKIKEKVDQKRQENEYKRQVQAQNMPVKQASLVKQAASMLDPISQWAQGKTSPQTHSVPFRRQKRTEPAEVNVPWTPSWIDQARLENTFSGSLYNYRNDRAAYGIERQLTGLGTDIISGSGLLGVW